jgi:hypothetical protein
MAELGERSSLHAIAGPRSRQMPPNNCRATGSGGNAPSPVRPIRVALTTSRNASLSNRHRRVAPTPSLIRRAVSSPGGFPTPASSVPTRGQRPRASENLHISRLGGAGHASSPASGYAGFAFRLQLARGPEQQRQHHASPAPPTPRRLYRSLRLLPGSGACPSYRWATPPALPAASLVRAI